MKNHGSDPQEYARQHPKFWSSLDRGGGFGKQDSDLFENWKENLTRIKAELANLEEHLAAEPDSDLYQHLHNLAECCNSLNYLVHWSMTYHRITRKSLKKGV